MSADDPVEKLNWINTVVPRGVMTSGYEIVAIPEAKRMFLEWKEEHKSPFDLDDPEGDE